MSIILKNKGDLILSFAAFFPVAVLMLQELLIASSIVDHESFRSYSVLLAAIPTVIALYYIVKREFLLFIITYSLLVYLTILTLILFPDNGKYVNTGLFYLFCVNIPCFLCLISIRDVIILKKGMLLISYIIFILGLVYIYFLLIGKITFLRYSMTFSYYLLFPALVFFSQKKIQFTLLFILICIFMLLLGSRGPLLASLIYVLVITIMDSKSRKSILLTIVILVISAGSIFSFFVILSDQMGVESRTVSMILEGNITDPTNRMDLYFKTWESIKETPFLGHGLFGDRVTLSGQYCHNIFLEIFSNFGLLLGSVLILLVFIVSIRVYQNSNKDGKQLFMMFFCYGFLPLLFSGSYLVNAGFGLFIGSFFLRRNQVRLRPAV
jgi:O-antigen ligase